MKIFTYNKAVAMRGRPKFSSPIRRIFYNAEQGKDKAFLLSEKGRFYIVEGEGVVDFPLDQLEQAAFEKYAEMRSMKLWMVVAVNSIKMRYKGSLMVVNCDLYDYHQKTLLKGKIIRVAKVYKNCNTLWNTFKNFDNEAINIKRLTINKDHQKLAEEDEYSKMDSSVINSLLLSVMAYVLALFAMGLFFFFSLFFALRGIKKFSLIVKSSYPTRKKAAYMCVACGLLACVCVVSIVVVIMKAGK